jgi:uncharacterized protein YheU (UPF0270 family)
MIIIPPDQLDPATLRALIEEFVTRDGAVHGHGDASTDRMAEQVLRQLRDGKVVIVYDEDDETTTIVEAPRRNSSS